MLSCKRKAGRRRQKA